MNVDNLLLMSRVLLVVTFILLIITIISFYKLNIRKAWHIVTGKTFKFKPTSSTYNAMTTSDNKGESQENENLKTRVLEAEQTRILETNETRVLVNNELKNDENDVTAVLKVIDV